MYDSETEEESDYVALSAMEVIGEAHADDEKGWELREYTLRDGAGNSLQVVFKHKKAGKEVKVEVISVQYNGGAVIIEAKNHMQVEYSEDRSGPSRNWSRRLKLRISSMRRQSTAPRRMKRK